MCARIQRAWFIRFICNLTSAKPTTFSKTDRRYGVKLTQGILNESLESATTITNGISQFAS